VANVSSIKKRNHDNSISSVVEKKANIAAIILGAQEKKRICVVDSENKEDV
jgi:hypothetical protein